MNGRSPHTRSPAFTLIELLIVVAIIAILALTDVPNFLEAQTRAKVSRVKADPHPKTQKYPLWLPCKWAGYGLSSCREAGMRNRPTLVLSSQPLGIPPNSPDLDRS